MSHKGIGSQYSAFCGVLTEETRGIINAIWKIDFSHEIDLLKIEDSNIANETKQARKLNIILEHRERRQPYVERLNERWQKQCRRSLVA